MSTNPPDFQGLEDIGLKFPLRRFLLNLYDRWMMHETDSEKKELKSKIERVYESLFSGASDLVSLQGELKSLISRFCKGRILGEPLFPVDLVVSLALRDCLDKDMLTRRNTETFFSPGVSGVQMASDFWLFYLMERPLIEQAKAQGDSGQLFDELAGMLLELYSGKDKLHLHLFLLYILNIKLRFLSQLSEKTTRPATTGCVFLRALNEFNRALGEQHLELQAEVAADLRQIHHRL